MVTEWNFDFKAEAQPVTLKPGRYKLECWGACGGKVTSLQKWSKGGYSHGELTLKKETILYVYIGERSLKVDNVGTFNGGGGGNVKGGGATDIRLISGECDNSQSLLSRILVAGGGGAVRVNFAYGNGGGLEGSRGIGETGTYSPGGTQYNGGLGVNTNCSGTFGCGGGYYDSTIATGGGGGWFGGAGDIYGKSNGGGGSSYVLTKDSYKPAGYIPTSEYWLENADTITGGGTDDGSSGKAKITLLQALPFLTISFYNSTTATFKADHTDPTLLTKIEYFIDDVLKETITTDLTLEKTINYTLEDNALHTLKIVVTDSANATAEKVLSISKNIMPLPENVNLQDISTKLTEVNAGFKTGKTSIINTLALKNIEASLNNTLVELSEKIKAGFDSGDASVQELQNRITELTNQLSQRKRYATGVATGVYTNYAPYQITTNLDFTPSIVYIKCNFPYYDYFRVSFSTNLTTIWCNPENDRPFSTRTYISDINSKGFRVRFIKKDGTDLTSLQTVPSQNNITWYAFE
ncbi:glycine rich protein [Clostridioides difficile]|uniref:glycine rich domain-containing protein n=1 Tax=Clostridioides difficile TaxID=1496 RepID=UPI001024D44B|nr:glycine rich domain-containing protein [Clostridioides difficile]VFF95003.1 glycine rich protein [Clostridioides difficile]